MRNRGESGEVFHQTWGKDALRRLIYRVEIIIVLTGVELSYSSPHSLVGALTREVVGTTKSTFDYT